MTSDYKFVGNLVVVYEEIGLFNYDVVYINGYNIASFSVKQEKSENSNDGAKQSIEIVLQNGEKYKLLPYNTQKCNEAAASLAKITNGSVVPAEYTNLPGTGPKRNVASLIRRNINILPSTSEPSSRPGSPNYAARKTRKGRSRK